MIPKFDLKKYLVPGDTIYIVVIVLGLFLLVFLNELPVRLIGACIALLSGVVLVMNLSARLKDRVEIRRPAPSQSVELSVKVKKDSTGTRYVFDDFESNFGGDDVPVSGADEVVESAEPKRMRFDDTDGSIDTPVVTRRTSAYKNETPKPSRVSIDEELMTDFSDDISGVRIKGRRTTIDSEMTEEPVQSGRPDTRASQQSTLPSSEHKKAVEVSSKKTDDAAPTPIQSKQSKDQRNASSSDKSSVRAEQLEKAESSAKQVVDTFSVLDVIESRSADSKVQADASASSAASKSTRPNPVPVHLTEKQTPPPTNVAPSLSATSPNVATVESLALHAEGQVQAEVSVPGAVPLSTEEVHSASTGSSTAAVTSAEAQSASKQRQLVLALANLIDDAEHPSEEEPRKEFDHLLSRVLMVIRSMMNARTAAFFWVNLEQDELVLETKITDAADVFRSQRKYPLGMDIVSQIARSGRPEILTEIKPAAQSDLIPYYSQPAGTTSFVGVPVFLNHTVIGVLCADSTQDDAYDEITIGSLGHFTKLISGLTQSYTGKYDLLQSSRTLEALAHFRSLVNKPGASMQQIAAALVESSASIVESQTIGVVLFNREQERWTIHNLSSQVVGFESLNEQAITTENSLISKTIFSGTTTCVSPVQKGVVRYHAHESALDDGFFIAVPLKSMSNCYGALFVEGHTSQLTERDISILETIGEQTGIILEQIHFQKMLKKSALMDEATGLLNSGAFINRLDEELVRARDNKVPLVCVLIAIDRYSAIERQLGQGDKEDIFMHVLSLARKYVRSYDAMGRFDENIIAIVSSGSKDNDTQLWAERLRKEVAISAKEIQKKRYTVTVSIGLAKAIADDNAESLLTNAGQAMELASAKTNNVVVFA